MRSAKRPFLLAAGFLCLLSKGFALGDEAPPTSAPAVVQTLPSKKGSGLSPELQVLEGLRSEDSDVRKDAIATLRNYIQSSPNKITKDLKVWIIPLRSAKLWNETLTLTEIGMPKFLSDVNAVSDFQQARVKALIELEQTDRALAEGKSAFNVAMQKTAERASGLLSQAIKLSSESATFDSAAIKAIKVEPGVYEAMLLKLPAEKKMDDYLAMGHIYLLADKPAEAREAFRAMLKQPDCKGKKMSAALEGIIRTERAMSGSLKRGDEMLAAMMEGTTDSKILDCIKDLNIGADTLETAAKRIERAVPVQPK